MCARVCLCTFLVRASVSVRVSRKKYNTHTHTHAHTPARTKGEKA